LLAADKLLRQNKAFRDAGKQLRVSSSREGFGEGAKYVLSLPGTPCAPKGAHGQTRDARWVSERQAATRKPVRKPP